MGCGCRKSKPAKTPAAQTFIPTNGRLGGSLRPAGQNPPVPTPLEASGPSMDQDRLRIERLRREAIRRSLGK